VRIDGIMFFLDRIKKPKRVDFFGGVAWGSGYDGAHVMHVHVDVKLST
jgi:hypothetical protein